MTAVCETPLDVPNKVRLGRVEAIRSVRSGALDVQDLIMQPPTFAYGWFVWDFLRNLPNIGHKTVIELGRAAAEAQVNLAMGLGELGSRERLWLARQIIPRMASPRGRPVIASRPQG